ncbi:hypothetical protein BCV70DRAFT_196903 [Testicularia cyperi]|uniref:Secreted protein n=1 Tax=Testicularia cyperi TaxID=1882483 RepID=A0A317XXL3_9BASI|nr:hypothetical protein BCV70DRAFT_196903 [Testicularia cyperi]
MMAMTILTLPLCCCAAVLLCCCVAVLLCCCTAQHYRGSAPVEIRPEQYNKENVLFGLCENVTARAPWIGHGCCDTVEATWLVGPERRRNGHSTSVAALQW